MKQLRVGVLGLGAFGASHTRAYHGLPYVEVAAVASTSIDRAEEFASEFEVPTYYGSYDELIDDKSIQAVSVTTSEDKHLEPVIASLAAGKHVLVEKPVASTLKDARLMASAARSSRGILMPGHILRFVPTYARMQAAVANGELGRLVSMSARRNRKASMVASHGRVHPSLITAIHDIDAMLWIAGCSVRRVQAIDRIATRDCGVHGLWGLLEFENGAVGSIETVWQLPSEADLSTDDSMHVIGTRGVARTQLDPAPLRLWTDQASAAPDILYEPLLHGAVSGALGNELAHFAQCAMTGKPSPIVSIDDGIRALTVALALTEAAESGRAISLETAGQ